MGTKGKPVNMIFVSRLFELIVLTAVYFLFIGCETVSKKRAVASSAAIDCTSNLPPRITVHSPGVEVSAGKDSGTQKGMVWIEGGTFLMGAGDQNGRPDEYPQHPVKVKGIWMDATEVTNAAFSRFVEATGYITTAERYPDWNELKKQLPEGTQKPPDSVLVPSSLVFTAPDHAVPLNNASQWWQWVKGASWKHPQGMNSSIKGKENYPVVQVSWDDAMAYAKWAGKRLPTEAEWEYAARAGINNQPYTWGSEAVYTGKQKTNIWQGHFPEHNTLEDGFATSSPVKTFAPNAYGLFDMAGNVWEWCADWYKPDYYNNAHNAVTDPKGPDASFDPEEPTVPKKVVRGGSFLCHESYCASYRVSARMKTSPDTGLEHTGFRCVKD